MPTFKHKRIIFDKMKNLVIIIICVFLIQCNGTVQKDHAKTNDFKTKDIFKVKESINYTNDTISFGELYIPSFSANTIWALHTNGKSYELNLSDSSWSNLESKIGIFSHGLKTKNIKRDVINDSLIWICNFHRGLASYNFVNGRLTAFNEIRPVSAVLFLDDYAIFGTWHGLYMINRKGNSAIQSQGLAGLHVSNIEPVDEEKLLINNQYEFSVVSDSVLYTRKNNENLYAKKQENGFEITSYETNEITIKKNGRIKKFDLPKYYINNLVTDKSNVWIPHRKLDDGIIRYDFLNDTVETIPVKYELYNFKTISDKEWLWFFLKDEILCFSKNDYSIKKHSFESKKNQITIDSLNLYMNTWHSIDVFNKAYFYWNMRDLMDFRNEEISFSRSKYRLQNDKGFIEYYKAYNDLAIKFKDAKSNRIRNELEMYRSYLAARLPYNLEEVKKIEAFVKDSIKDKDIEASYYLHAIMIANHTGNFNTALKYDSVLIRDYPEYRDRNHENNMKEVLKSYQTILQVELSDEMKDVKLWKTGKAYYDAFRFVGPRTEASTTNMSLPFKFFDTLINKYPESKFSDNATYLILGNRWADLCEGGDNETYLRVIEAYETFLSDYPDSELIPAIYMELIMLNKTILCPYDEKTKYYKQALKYIEKATSLYPNYEYAMDMQSQRTAIENAIAKHSWHLKTETNKFKYKTYEPIFISFELKNTFREAQSISIFADSSNPNFRLNIVGYENQQKFRVDFERESWQFNHARIDSVIQPGEIYYERWEIKTTANNSYDDPPGKFIINKPGKYYIQPSFRIGMFGNVPSVPFFIEVE